MKQSATEKAKLKAARTQVAILALLGISAAHYNIVQYEMGLAYLKKLYNVHDDTVLPHEHSPMFWAWWKNTWRNRDELFIHHTLDYIHISGNNAPCFVMENPFDYFKASHYIDSRDYRPGMHIILKMEAETPKSLPDQQAGPKGDLKEELDYE